MQNNSNGFLQFSSQPLTTRFKDLFTTKVGAVPKSKTQAQLLGENANGRTFVHSKTVKDHSLVIYDLNSEWIRPWTGETARLFVNCKTREKLPFFTPGSSEAWDGSVIALFPTEFAKSRFKSLNEACDYLNSLNWFELGCESADGRKQFSVGAFDRMMLS